MNEAGRKSTPEAAPMNSEAPLAWLLARAKTQSTEGGNKQASAAHPLTKRW